MTEDKRSWFLYIRTIAVGMRGKREVRIRLRGRFRLVRADQCLSLEKRRVGRAQRATVLGIMWARCVDPPHRTDRPASGGGLVVAGMEYDCEGVGRDDLYPLYVFSCRNGCRVKKAAWKVYTDNVSYCI